MSGLVFYFLKTTERVHRLGIVASRRTGSAVVRNKFRRRFRLLYSLLRNSLAQPHDAVVIATTPEAVGMDFLTLQSIFANRLNKLIKIESDCC